MEVLGPCHNFFFLHLFCTSWSIKFVSTTRRHRIFPPTQTINKMNANAPIFSSLSIDKSISIEIDFLTMLRVHGIKVWFIVSFAANRSRFDWTYWAARNAAADKNVTNIIYAVYDAAILKCFPRLYVCKWRGLCWRKKKFQIYNQLALISRL